MKPELITGNSFWIKKLFVIIAILNFGIAAAEDFNVDGIEYYIIPNTTNVAVSGNNGQYSGDIVIPSTVTYASVVYAVTAIRGVAFYNCNGLTSVTLPNSITTIGDSAFSNCTSLTSINVPSSVTSIGHSAFMGCISLPSITIPDGITTIRMYTFFVCTSLTSVTIPDSVTSIEQSAFGNCTSLPSVTIPNAVTSIGVNAFSSCTSLTLVDCRIPTPLAIDASVFGNVNQPECTLTVPACSAELYQAAAVWQDFNPIQERSTCSLSLDEALNRDNISVYPNPVTNKLVIKNSFSGNLKLKVFNEVGQLVLKQDQNTLIVSLDVSTLSKGLYFLNIISEANKTQTIKFIKN
ncbi:leucine-rich repeat domain-containing protein [Hwangdonia lutea]|uniref:Leucine-rich repeat domain-containing protein n=1 Tax=Hwangdonia lutea TaxID=3075823 RepID=A0AA97ENH2_9FLAO|nr:leucine-rich repeat domain-containing protein [Hwangdonia sp. SCSIO 19198]WOD44624.1 leucine-rich repeat domain-containing protein [Hwangdonia sp. SCSIO 19198]